MSSARRGRRGSGSKKTESVADINQRWLQTIDYLSSNSDPGVELNKHLTELCQLALQTITRSHSELEADILLIGGHLSLVGCIGTEQDFLSGTTDDKALLNMQSAFCRILAKLLNRPKASLSVIGFRDLIRLILQWTEQSLEADDITLATVDSISALGAILTSYQSQMQASLQHALTIVFSEYCYKPPSALHSKESDSVASSVELCLVASDALHALVSSRTDVQPQIMEKMMEGIVNMLHRNKPVANPSLTGMYASLLRTLTTLISQGRGCHIPYVASLMEIISAFFRFGVQSSLKPVAPSDSTSDPSSDGSSSRYVPPALRTSDTSGYSSMSGSAFSGNETSPRGIRSSDQQKTAKIRLATLNLVQKMSQVDGKSLHPFWRVLLPFRQPLQRFTTTPHLINVLLYDPHPQVRMSAAGTIAILMEGRAQKGFLSIAELSDRDTSAIRGFTTLSLSLGRMVLALHDGLLHAIENEEKISVIPHLFRTLNSVISATRYDRMPSDLRIRMVKSIQKQWTAFHDQGDGDIAREAACMIALRTILGSVPADPKIEQYLDDRSASLHDQSRLGERTQKFLKRKKRSGWSLLDALFAVAHSYHDVVRSEALAGLTCAATNYGNLFKGRWREVTMMLDRNIHQQNLEQSGSEEKSAQQSIRLFGALIAHTALMEETHLLERARATVPVHIIPSFAHSSPVLRSAALTEIGGASKVLLTSLPRRILQRLLDAALSAALEDPVVAVRSSACRMIGDMVNAGFYLTEKSLFYQTVSVLASCLENHTISVRISSSWSLANVADAIGRDTEKLPHISRDAVSLKSLADAAITASRDHEKVRANGIRALGHLLRETHFSDDQVSVGWLYDAVACLQSSLGEGSAKVKWNACYATGSLASNATLKETVNSNGTLSKLIGLLVHLLNDNPNFKVQMQAAAAIDNVSAKSAFEETFFPAISAVARRLQILQDGSQDAVSEEKLETTLIQPTVDASFPNFKYHEALKHQLEFTLMHLITLLDSPFSNACVFPRADILFSWLKRKVDDVCEAESEDEKTTEIKIRLQNVLRSLVKYEQQLADWNSLAAKLNAE